MIYIEVKAFGDFDMEYTDSIWAGEGSKKVLVAQFQEEYGTELLADQLPQFKKFLKRCGFTQLKTSSVSFGD